MKRKAGFTMIEIMIVIVIIGVLAAVALPRLSGQQESSVVPEGVATLGSLYHAQKMYELDHAAFTANCTLLEITARNSNNFAAPICSTVDPVVSIQRSNGNYTLNISSAGVFSCAVVAAGFDCSPITRLLPK